jgi:hypothetical protein
MELPAPHSMDILHNAYRLTRNLTVIVESLCNSTKCKVSVSVTRQFTNCPVSPAVFTSFFGSPAIVPLLAAHARFACVAVARLQGAAKGAPTPRGVSIL